MRMNRKCALSFMVIVILLSNGASSDDTDVSPVLLSNSKESKALFDHIDAMINSSSPENRDYPTILQQIGTLSDTFPESRETITMLETLEMWKSLDLISEEQYSPFEKKLSEYRSAEAKGMTFFAGVEKQHQKYLSTKDKDLLERIIKSCQDVLDTRGASKKMKCHALLFLATIYLEIDEIGKSESYLKNLIDEQHLVEQNFSGVEGLVSEANNLKANVLLKKKGTGDTIAYWNEFIETGDRRFDEIAHAYKQIFLLLHESREEDADERKIHLLEEFIAKYPNDSSSEILQARLNLGYAILNNGMHISGDVTMEQVQMYAEKHRANAEKAEIVLQESLALAKNTPQFASHFEEAFHRALEEVARAKNPQYAREPDGVAMFPPKSNKIFVTFVVIANILFILLLVYVQRERIIRLINQCFHNP